MANGTGAATLAGNGEVGFLAKERIIAGPHFNRWLVPPAALAIHLCIGMAYGFSVFWLPLSRAVGITQSVACPADMSVFARIFATSCDWKISELGWMFTLFFVFLGSAAAIWGGWLERAGPRKAGFVAAVCWCGGLVISSVGVTFHLEHGVARARVYDVTAYILCGLLVIGFICNWLVRPVADKHFMTDAELQAERKLSHEAAAAVTGGRPVVGDRPSSPAVVVAAWILVGVPILWGVWITLQKAWVLF